MKTIKCCFHCALLSPIARCCAADGVRISSSASVESLLLADLDLVINDITYRVVVPPQHRSTMVSTLSPPRILGVCVVTPIHYCIFMRKNVTYNFENWCLSWQDKGRLHCHRKNLACKNFIALKANNQHVSIMTRVPNAGCC